MKHNSKIELTPAKWVDNGFTIAYADGKTIFCTGGIPGKLQNFIIEKETSKLVYARAETVDSDCSAYPECGGCSYRHISYEEELNLKTKQVKKNLDLELDSDLRIDLIFESPIGYRNNVQWKKERNAIGFFERFSNRVVDLRRIGCKNLSSVLNDIEISHKAPLDWRLSMTQSGAQVPIPYKNQDTYLSWRNYSFRIPKSGFMQVNSLMIPRWAECLRSVTDRLIRENSKVRCIEFFCGSGFIGQILSPYINELYGIEVDRNSVEYAKRNAIRNGVERYTYIARDLFRSLESNSLPPWDQTEFIILNPPRSGAGRPLMDFISKISPNWIMYSSCDIQTLSRDWKYLQSINSQYRLDSVYLLDFFPRTKHFETLVSLVKSDFL